jgi:hypothetical protein
VTGRWPLSTRVQLPPECSRRLDALQWETSTLLHRWLLLLLCHLLLLCRFLLLLLLQLLDRVLSRAAQACRLAAASWCCGRDR